MSFIKRKVDATVEKDVHSSSPSSKSSKTHHQQEEVGSNSSAGKLKSTGGDDDTSKNDDSSSETKREESTDSFETSSDYEQDDDQEEEDEEEEEEEEEPRITNVQTCSKCPDFCTSWTRHYARGSSRISCGMTSHHSSHCCNPYSYMVEEPTNNTKIVMGSPHGWSVDQRVTFLCSLYKLSKTNEEFRIFADPQFLQLNFKNLIHEQKVIRVAVLYGWSKLFPEALVLARNCGVVELEEKFGKFKVYEHAFLNDDDDDNRNESGNVRPFEVAEIVSERDEHFSLSWEQWKKLRTYAGSSSCCMYIMSIFTSYNRSSVNVKSILRSIDVI